MSRLENQTNIWSSIMDCTRCTKLLLLRVWEGWLVNNLTPNFGLVLWVLSIYN